MKKTKINIIYTKRVTSAERSIPWVKELSEYLKIDPEITLSSTLQAIKEDKFDLIISPAGTGHHQSKSSRALSTIIQNHSCPKLLVTKGIFSEWGKMMTFSYIDGNGNINFFPRKKLINPTHIGAMSKRRPHNFSLKPWRRDGDYLLFCAQNSRPPYFSYHNKMHYNDWAYDCIEYMLANSNDKIIYRFHPRKFSQNRNLRFAERLTALSDRIEISPAGKPLLEDLAGAKKMITYNSGVAIKSIFEGIPTVVGCRYFTGSAAVVGYENFKTILKPSRADWFYRLMHTTWSTKEVQAGNASSYLYELGMKKDFRR